MNEKDKFIIEGGKPLSGEINVSGAKNSTLAIIAACLLTEEECTLANVPIIEDVKRMLEIFKKLGVKVEWPGEHKLTIQAKELNLKNLDSGIICQLRASVFLMGALLSRFSELKIPPPGGCQIGARPLNPHLEALKYLGVKVTLENGVYSLSRKTLVGREIVMSEISVTATENLLLLASLAEGKTIIHCAAADHYVSDLAWFLTKMGAKIKGIGTHDLEIEGVKKLKGVKNYTIMPDPIESGTFLALAAATRSALTVKNTAPEFLRAELLKFQEANVNFQLKENKKVISERYQLKDIVVKPASRLRALKKIHNMPYPGLTADLLPPLAVLMTQAEGTSLIHDWMYEGRLRYVNELVKMGANAVICDPHRVIVVGPTPLYGQEIESLDIRAGATLVIAALVAEGQSIISDVYKIDRGYENIEGRLKALGAKIKRVGQ